MKSNIKKNIVAIVPARGGSKGIPYKNIKLLNGKPLIYYTLNNLLKVKTISRLIVSTEDKKIKKVVKKYFPKIEIMDRPKKLADGKTTLTEVVKYISKKIKTKDYHPDFVLQIAPTCPFIKPITVKRVIEILVKKKTDCVVTLKRIEHEHPYRAKKLNKKNNSFKSFLTNINVEKFMSRQDLPTLYCTSGAIYGRTYNLQQTFNPNKKSFCFGKNPIGVVLNDIESINIDRPIDFKFAEFISKKKIDGN